MSRDAATHRIDVKIENDRSVDQGSVTTEDTHRNDTTNRQSSPLFVAVEEIKIEYDDSVNQDPTDQETSADRTSDMACRSTTEDVILSIKTENDHDVECGSTATEDYVAHDIKIEIINPEEYTDIDTVYRPTLPSDVPFNSVKDENCQPGWNQDGASGSATNTDVNRGDTSSGEDYSSAAGPPAAETIHKAQLSDTAVQQVTKAPGDSTGLLSNMSAHSGKRQSTCEICHKRFPKKSKLVIHMRIHSEEKPFTCQVCHKRFPNKSSLARHMRIHSGEKPFACEVCHKRFSQKGHLVDHMRIHSDEKLFTCEVCHKRFSKKSNLVIHMRIHSGEKPFACEVCHTRFIKKSDLARHMRIHSGEKPFACEVCHKRFSQKGHLVDHMRKHSGEKLFTCDVCHKRYSQKSNLVTHMRIHSGEKPFTCEVCHKTFSQKGSLATHTRIHSKEKPLLDKERNG